MRMAVQSSAIDRNAVDKLTQDREKIATLTPSRSGRLGCKP